MADLSDRTDNVSLTKDDGTLPVDVIVDSNGKNRLAVDAIIPASAVTPENISSLVDLGYVYSVGVNVSAASAGTHNPLLYIKNPSGSGKQIYLYKMTTGITVANVFMNFRIYGDPTTSANGTAVTPVNRDFGGGWGASALNVYTVPTVTALGTNILANWVIGQNTNSLDGVEAFSLHVAANHTILITGNPSSNNREAAINVAWAEF